MTVQTLEALLDQVSRPHRRAARMAVLCATAAAIAGILLLGLSGWFITGASLAGAAGIIAVQAFNYLLPSAAISMLAILRTIARYGERLYGHQAALSSLASFRVRLFERMIEGPTPDLGRTGGETATLLLQDIDALEDRFVRMPGNAAAVAGAITALVLTIPAGPAAMLALAAILATLSLSARLFSRRHLPALALKVQQDIAALKRDFVEYAAASAEIAAYALGRPVEDHLQRQADRLDRDRIAFARAEAWLAAMTVTAGGVAMAAVISLSSTTLPLTLLAGLSAAGAIEAVGASVRSSGRDAVVAAGLERLADLVGSPVPSAVLAPPLSGNRLEIRTGRETVTLSRGDRLVITGRSGAGKTSLLECLAGWRATCATFVAIDGVPIATHRADARQPLFALSPQNGQMIAGTIADNLRLARPSLADTALWEALEVACFADDVRAMPAGLATWIGDGGARLSGGQRKRLSLARALLAGRPWLLLDEPSEGLDPRTEASLIGNLDRWVEETQSGLILVTHRAAMLPLSARHLDLCG